MRNSQALAFKGERGDVRGVYKQNGKVQAGTRRSDLGILEKERDVTADSAGEGQCGFASSWIRAVVADGGSLASGIDRL